MSFFAWIVVGLIAGFIGGKLSGASTIILHVVIGIVGAIVGGWLIFGHTGTGLNVYSLFGSVIGSIVALFIYKSVGNPRKLI